VKRDEIEQSSQEAMKKGKKTFFVVFPATHSEGKDRLGNLFQASNPAKLGKVVIQEA